MRRGPLIQEEYAKVTVSNLFGSLQATLEAVSPCCLEPWYCGQDAWKVEYGGPYYDI